MNFDLEAPHHIPYLVLFDCLSGELSRYRGRKLLGRYAYEGKRLAAADVELLRANPVRVLFLTSIKRISSVTIF